MAEKLSITIFLEGAAEIERQLEGIGQAGTKAFSEIGNAAEKVGGFDKLDPKDVTKKLEQFGVKGKAAIDKITAAVAAAGRLERIVGGVRAVEDGFAKLGVAASAMSQRVTTAFTAVATAAASTGGAVGRLGRAFGILGSGAVIGSVGAAAVAMEKAADSARILERNLQALFNNAQAGSAAFNTITDAARAAGANVEDTAKRIIDIVRTLRSELEKKGVRFLPGVGIEKATQDAAQFFDTLQKGMKLSGVRADEANKAIGKLFDEISKKGQLSGETLRQFGQQFPQLANELVKFLGTPGQSMQQLADQVDRGLKKIDINKFINALKRADPEIQKLFAAFDQTLAQRMDSIGAAWERLLDSFAKSPSGDIVKKTLDDIAKGLDEVARAQAEIGKFTVDKPFETSTGEFLNEVRKTIATTKQEWEALVAIFNQTMQNLGKRLPDKIVIPFEADPNPPFVETYLQLIEKVKTAFKSIFTPDVAALGAAEPPFVQIYLAAIARVKAAFAAIFTPTVAAEGAPEPAFVQTYLAAIETVKNALTTISWDTITSAGVAAWNAITGAIQSTQSAIQQFASSLSSITWDAISGAGVAAWNAVISAIERAISVIGTFLGLSGRAGGGPVGAGATGSFQGGGLLGGRGTGTSDSNLVRVSRGEYIIPARAVRQPGVLAFLEALRQSGGSLRDVLDGMGRFALGGLVPRTMPAFATGGLAGGGMSNVTIQFPGMPEISGLRAPAKVVDELRKAAAMAQVRSGGRKPSRYS